MGLNKGNNYPLVNQTKQVSKEQNNNVFIEWLSYVMPYHCIPIFFRLFYHPAV